MADMRITDRAGFCVLAMSSKIAFSSSYATLL